MTRIAPWLPHDAWCRRRSLTLALSLCGGVLPWATAQTAAVAPAAVAADRVAEIPARVGRLADTHGPVFWFDLEQGRWMAAQPNRPLTAGDRVSTGPDGRATLRIGSSSLRLSEATDVELLRLDEQQLRVQLHRGSLAVRVSTGEQAAQTVIGTQQAWVQPRRAGLARLDRPDAQGDTTYLSSWRGEWQVLDEPGLLAEAGQRLQLRRDSPQQVLHTRPAGPVDDAFAAWVQAEDRVDDRTAYAGWVPAESTGQEDLHRHGRWEQHPEHGRVWLPQDVAPDWAPYRQGRWEYLRPWGWVWMDDARWGFTPYHYGRWVSWQGRWCWVPGPRHTHPVVLPPGAVQPPTDRRRPAPPPRRHALDGPPPQPALVPPPAPPLPLAVQPLPSRPQPMPSQAPLAPTAPRAPAANTGLNTGLNTGHAAQPALRPEVDRPTTRPPVPAPPGTGADSRLPRVRTPEQAPPDRKPPEPKPGGRERDRERGVQQQ